MPCEVNNKGLWRNGRAHNFLTKESWFEYRLAQFFSFFLLFILFFNIQMFFYIILNIFITLLENVNKSRTSAGSLSLSTWITNDNNLTFVAQYVKPVK
jgi:hypothetical protein